MTNKTQLRWVKSKIAEQGYITRNQCLKQFISRLGALIHTLKKQGYEFDTEYIKVNDSKDFKYTATKIPQGV